MHRLMDRLLLLFVWLCGGGVLLAVLALLGFLLWRGMARFSMELFFGQTPWLQAITGRMPVFDGIWPALVGTTFLVALSCLLAVPVGAASGIYLARYAPPRVRSILGFAVDLLAGTPSIVMGLSGFTLILMLRKTFLPEARTCLFLASLCIALLILPYVIRTTQSAFEAIPESLRLVGPAIGLSRWQSIRHVLLPLASRGILGGIILAVGRAAEDTAVILLTGVVARAGMPFSLRDRFEALPFHIYYLAAEHRSADQLNEAFGAALVLLLVTGILFLVAFGIQRGAEKQWRLM
jgi:phosphate transport system permease protein